MSPRDRQVSRVYEWEKALAAEFELLDCKLDLPECAELVQLCLDAFGCKARIRVWEGTDPEAAQASWWDVELPDWARTPLTVIHESAHVLGYRWKLGGEDHDGRFVRTEIELLAELIGLDRQELEVSAWDHRIAVARRSAIRAINSCPEVRAWLMRRRSKSRRRKLDPNAKGTDRRAVPGAV